MAIYKNISVDDETFKLFDDVTPTKIAEFELSGITPATTRTFTFPNVDMTFAGTNFAQTFTEPQSISTITNATQALSITKTITNAVNSNECVIFTNTSVVNDAGTYTKTGPAFEITQSVTETSGTITDTSTVLNLNQTHADASGEVLSISNAGTGNDITATNWNITKAGAATFVSVSGDGSALTNLPVSGSNRLTTVNNVVVTTTTAETNLMSFTLPANSLSTANGVSIRLFISDFNTQAAVNVTWRLKYGVTTIATTTVSGNRASEFGVFEALLTADGATGAQRGSFNLPRIEDDFGSGTSAEDSTTALTLAVTIEFALGTAAENITVNNGYAELIQ